MKAAWKWVVLFAILVGFGWLVRHGSTWLGVPDYIWLPLNLTAFLFVLYRFVGKPMGSFLDGRREEIAASLEDARTKLAEAERLRAEVDARLAEVETEVAELRARAGEEGKAEAEQIAEQTRHDEERFLKRVDDEISRRQADTRKQLARETAELTAQIAREILSSEMTDADRNRVFDRSLAAMQALDDKE